MSESIAIVGMACVYPEARSPTELWENVLAQRRAFRRIPAERLRTEDYLDPDPHAVDRTYSVEAAVIEGYDFDRVAFRVVGSTYRSADLAHWLALDVASRALADAGFQNGEGLDRTMTGVVLGNTLTGEFSRANILRLRWPYVRRVLDSAMVEHGWSSGQRAKFLGRLEERYKAPFPPVGEETLAGGLSNTIAGRICNQFDFKGGGYTIDGACASSLLAIANACSALAASDLDVALAGGVDLSLDPFEIVGFAKTGALAPELMRIYDAHSAGFWPGEGCGFVVLMRHGDAVAQGRRIYALIRGWGISSDGAGGITRPEADGQIQALRRAYRRSGYGIDTVAYFEGHGTGTSVGDATELQVISRARREVRPDAPPAAIGSIKANIGHAKAAAGIAGLIKATLAVHTQTLPPTTGCEEPHRELCGPSPALRVLREPEPWPGDRPLRAAASAMGFGGMNAHITLESTATERRRRLNSRERGLASSPQDAELFLLAAANADGLSQQVQRLLAFAARLSRSELTDLAAELSKHGVPAAAGSTSETAGRSGQSDVTPAKAYTPPAALRAAVIASSPAELAKRLTVLKSWIDESVTQKFDLENGLFLSDASTAPRIGFLFPGQGSPSHLDGGILRRRFDFVRELYDRANLPADGDGLRTDVAQPALVTASLAGLRVLNHLGLAASVAVGHSLGEITALHWAGAFDGEALVRIARVRGQAMAKLGIPTGRMAAIAATAEEVCALIDGNAVSIVGFNSPRQTVIAGEATAVNSVAERAQGHGLRAVALPVSHAFHTPLVAGATSVLAEQLSQERICDPQRHIVSTITGAALKKEDDLRDLLCRQVTSPVRFIEALTAAAEGVDLFIEVGPGQVLSGLAADSVSAPVIALDACGPSLKGLLQAAAAAFVLGAPVDHAALFSGRFTRPFNLDWQPKFFANPCEQAPIPQVEENQERMELARHESERVNALPTDTDLRSADSITPEQSAIPNPQSAIELVREIVAARAELPVTAVKDDSRMLSDLHLNSITVGQLVAEAAKRLHLPPLVDLTHFANMTVGKIAEAFEELARGGGGKATEAKQRAPSGVGSWVRTFTVKWVERPLPTRLIGTTRDIRDWQVIAPPSHPLAAPLRKLFTEADGEGVVLCLPTEPGEAHVKLLLQSARAVLGMKQSPHFVLVQHGWGAGGFARTLHLEHPEITTSVADVPFDHLHAANWVRQEAFAAQGYREARYDVTGVRREPRLQLLPLPEQPGELPLGPDDVLLVTGGGKGIAAECALALGRKTGTQLVLAGRSQPSTDAELAANLARIAAAGVRCRYLAVDVTDSHAVKGALAEAERDMGKITAFLHGAGTNVPQLINSLSEAAFLRTLSPKIQGARNVLAAIHPEQLRLFITFSSIIARTGLPGEADYAVANEWLTNLTEEFQAEHPNCRCLAAEWSVWSGLGMGQRLGRIESLTQQGITPISPEMGVEMLEQLLRHSSPSVAAVVTGRFGELPTLKLEKPDLPFLRFLEQPKVFYPGVELIVDSVLSSDTDPYVEDHIYHGERLFPAVMGLEAMAQAAMALAGSKEPPSFENVKLSRPVIVPRNGKVTIRVAALLRKAGEVEVALRSDESRFQVDHFRATCCFGTEDPESQRNEAPFKSEIRNPKSDKGVTLDRSSRREEVLNPQSAIEQIPLMSADTFETLKSQRVSLEPVRDLYEELLFHTGRFRRVRNYRLLRAKECLVQVEPAAEAVWFGRYLPPDRVLGDAAVRDAAIHAIQACVPHARLLPVGVERVVIGKIPCLLERVRTMDKIPELLLHARERSRDGDTFCYDLALLGEDGTVLEKWEGLRLRKVEELPRRTPWTPALLGPYVERRVQEMVSHSAIAVALEFGGPDDRSARSDAVIRHLLGDCVCVQRRSDGRPDVDGKRSVSAAHAGKLTLAVAGPAPIGCDLEPVSARSASVWHDLLGRERFSLAERVAIETAENFNASATRVWTALECFKKAVGGSGAPLGLEAAKKDGWVLLSSGTLTIATYVAHVRDAAERLAIAVLIGGASEHP